MGKTKVVELTAKQRTVLEKDYRTGKSHCFRTRCQMILLKSEKRTSTEVAEVLGCCEMVVNNWLAHYEKEGIFTEQIEKWMERDLYVFFLPRYSPHLNLAETFWREAKYEWLRPSDYSSFAKYKKKVKAIFNNIGLEYKIAFSQMSV